MNSVSSLPENRILAFLRENVEPMTALLRHLVLAESPSSEPDSQREILTILRESFENIDYRVEELPGVRSGGYLVARPRGGVFTGKQLLLGHCDTVWPLGTIQTMPFRIDGNVIHGPGVYDMKGGLTQLLFALRALKNLNYQPVLEPVILINSDEERGSIDSEQAIRRLAQDAVRVFVLEPSLGPDGKLKTARKGVGKFSVKARGQAAHAGLAPEEGASAILEIASVIQKLNALNDLVRGISINIGTIVGGIQPNVIAPNCRIEVDLRVPTTDEADRLESAILNLEPSTPGVTLEITGGISRPPMELTRKNQHLYLLAQSIGSRIGIELEQGMAGGGSDGNTTSKYTATLDGLGAVGAGAHARHEYLYLDKMVERSALLALLVLASPS